MDKDLKDSIKKIQKKRERYERLEKLVIFFTGVIAVLIFLIIGLNVYSGLTEKVSEPEINIVENENIKKPVKVEKENSEKKEIEGKVKEVKKQETKKIANKTEIKEKQSLPKKQETKKAVIAPPEKLELPKEKISEQKNEQFQTSFYTIQIGAFKTKINAEKHIKKHKLENAFVLKEKNLYKVMVGKFKTKKEAVIYKREYKLKGFIKHIKD
jgi:septal ring-binding cell division protein DamX